MTVSFEYNDKIIANAELSIVPAYAEVIRIWNKDYEVFDVRHEVEIKQKPSGKKSVVEKIIVEIIELEEE